ncbi:MAG: hypothetical protein GTN93_10435, partial [Anaerolineae bacterium]|nr:hypothetical protein [Anaerolineae bacterium]
MAIVVKKFSIGKNRTLDELNRFFLENELRTANIISVEVQTLSSDTTDYILTYEDTTAPFVFSTNPTQGQSGVSEGATITIIFSEPIQTVTNSDVEITNLSDSVVVSTTRYILDNSGIGDDQGTLRIVDSGGTPPYLEAGKAYRVSLKTTIVDLAGNPLETEFNLFFGVGTTLVNLTFDGGTECVFSNPSLNRWETTVTPSTISFTNETIVQLTLKGQTGAELDGFNLHYEPIAAPTGTFRIVLEHGNRLQTPEPTGILPPGTCVDWL